MEGNTKVLVTNSTDKTVNVALPDIKFKRTWQAMASLKVEMEVLQEAIYDRGFIKFLEKGILIIEDKSARVELGLEEEEGEPMVVVISRSEMARLLQGSDLIEFREKLSSITSEQCLTLAEMAIARKVSDINKSQIIKEFCGVDVIKNIQLNALNEEEG